MPVTTPSALDRRSFLATTLSMGAAGLAAPALAQAVDPYTGQLLQGTPGAGATPDAGVVQYDAGQDNRRNVSSFRMHDWQPYFSDLTNGAILVDLTSRALSYWSEDGTDFRLFPTSIPVSEDLTRRGRTEIIKKVKGPSWSPTPEMKKRNPEWPDFVPPGQSGLRFFISGVGAQDGPSTFLMISVRPVRVRSLLTGMDDG